MILASRPEWEMCGEAGDGPEAVQKGAELQPDLVILDLVMPAMNGLEVAGLIYAAAPKTRILLHTNHAFPALAREAENEGVRFIVHKGGPVEHLLTAVEALLNEKASAHEKPSAPNRRKPPASPTGAPVDD